MSMPIRHEFAGALNHVTSRGDHWEAIYEDDADLQKFIALLDQAYEDYAIIEDIPRFALISHGLSPIDSKLTSIHANDQRTFSGK